MLRLRGSHVHAGQERLDQFLGCLPGVIAEGLVVDFWIIQQSVEPDQIES